MTTASQAQPLHPAPADDLRVLIDITVSDDGQAHKVSAVLGALGYTVTRTPGPASTPEDRMDAIVAGWSRDYKLADREQDILKMVLDGNDNQQIGLELGISKATVKWHMHNLFAKTNTSNVTGLLRLALRGCP